MMVWAWDEWLILAAHVFLFTFQGLITFLQLFLLLLQARIVLFQLMNAGFCGCIGIEDASFE